MKLLHYISSPCSSAVAASLCLLLHCTAYTQIDTMCGIAWEPRIHLSADYPHYYNFSARLALDSTDKNIIHCTWWVWRDTPTLPYIRSTNGGVSFSPAVNLFEHTGSQLARDAEITIIHDTVYVFWQDPECDSCHPYILRFRKNLGAINDWSPITNIYDSVLVRWNFCVTGDTIIFSAIPKSPEPLKLLRTTNLGNDWTYSPRVLSAEPPGFTFANNALHLSKRWGVSGISEFEMFYQKSTDLGDTWIDSLPISAIDSNHNTATQSISSDGGMKLNITWGDTKYGCMGLSGCSILGRYSTTGGESWEEEYLLTEHPVGMVSRSAYTGEKLIVAWGVDSMFFGGIQAGISYNAGADWCTPMYISEDGGEPHIIITSSYVFLAWEEFDTTLQTWQLYGRRGTFITTSVPEEEYHPLRIALEQNYPNPFNPTTTIKFSIPLLPPLQRGTGGFVTLKIYNIYGQEVATLINNKQMEAGEHTVEWNAEKFPSGMYFYRLSVTSHNNVTSVITKKMIVMK
jgi:hypothetical protein